MGTLWGHQSVICKLLARLGKEDDTRVGLAWTLGKVANGDQATIAALIRLLEEDSWRIKWNAVKALGETSSRGDEAVIYSIVLLIEKETALEVVDVACQALGKVAHGDKDCIAALISLLQKNEWETRRNAAKALLETCP